MLVASTLLLAVAEAQAGTAMPTAGPTSQPVGHYEFCQRYPGECRRNPVRAVVKLTPALWAKITEINYSANVSIFPRTDDEMHGVPELWSYPTDQGDCEDYVLYKQRALEKEGVPASALLITVVKQRNGDGHAVLTVRTDQGDYVLDNLDDRVLSWDMTPYTYLKRQSDADAGRWVAVEDYRDVLVGSVR
jgi:predicted transglutaminase-like cysteine proteinase